MRKTVMIGSIAAVLAVTAALPTLAQRTFDPGLVSADKVINIDSTEDGTWALTSSGKVLFCSIPDDKAPKVVCFDQGGRTGIDY